MLIRRLAPAAALVAVLVALAGCGADSSSTAGQPSDNSAGAPTAAPRPSGGSTSAPSVVPENLRFTGTTLDGMPFHGASLAGKPTVVWFWAPWCPKCRAQAQATAEVARDYQGRANVVGVAGLDKVDAMRRFVSDQKVSGFPHLSDESGAIWKRFAITEQSVYVVLDAKGTKVFAGNLPAGEGLAEKVAELVG